MANLEPGTARHRPQCGGRWRAAAVLGLAFVSTGACTDGDDTTTGSASVASTDAPSASSTDGGAPRDDAAGATASISTSAASSQDAAASTAEAQTATVIINTFNFQPDPLTVSAGTVITFVNEDAIDHTVTAGTREAPQPELFDGVLPEKGATLELTLDEPGTYEYFCSRHTGPGMTATIVVE